MRKISKSSIWSQKLGFFFFSWRIYFYLAWFFLFCLRYAYFLDYRKLKIWKTYVVSKSVRREALVMSVSWIQYHKRHRDYVDAEEVAGSAIGRHFDHAVIKIIVTLRGITFLRIRMGSCEECELQDPSEVYHHICETPRDFNTKEVGEGHVYIAQHFDQTLIT